MNAFLKFLVLFLLCATIFACTSIPETDTIPPNIRFELRIPSTDAIVITSEDEFDEILINLRPDSRNAFLFLAADTGGLRLMQMQYPNDLELTGVSSDFTIRDASALSKMLEWTGDPSNPARGIVAAGDIVVPPRSELGGDSGSILLFASDFGGSPGTPNNTRKTISIQFEDALPVGVVRRF